MQAVLEWLYLAYVIRHKPVGEEEPTTLDFVFNGLRTGVVLIVFVASGITLGRLPLLSPCFINSCRIIVVVYHRLHPEFT